jgi:hypothetical protein
MRTRRTVKAVVVMRKVVLSSRRLISMRSVSQLSDSIRRSADFRGRIVSCVVRFFRLALWLSCIVSDPVSGFTTVHCTNNAVRLSGLLRLTVAE